jgi:hypothetical protein
MYVNVSKELGINAFLNLFINPSTSIAIANKVYTQYQLIHTLNKLVDCNFRLLFHSLDKPNFVLILNHSFLNFQNLLLSIAEILDAKANTFSFSTLTSLVCCKSIFK